MFQRNHLLRILVNFVRMVHRHVRVGLVVRLRGQLLQRVILGLRVSHLLGMFVMGLDRSHGM